MFPPIWRIFMSKKMFCDSCGAEIFIDFVVPTQSYFIDDDGIIHRADNREFDYAGFEAYCSNDRECECYPLDLEKQKEFDLWLEEAEQEIIKSSLLIQMILKLQEGE